jgi:hypothetical protein
MKILYRTSDVGYKKIKPDYINNENCLKNFVRVFNKHINDIIVIADNPSDELLDDIKKYIPINNIVIVKIGNGAGTFNTALDIALTFDDNEVVYFVENDYLHREYSDIILMEGINMGAHFVSLYDHPDKYLNPNEGGNPHCEGKSEITRVYLTDNCHWKITNSTTMTFASKVSTLKSVEKQLREYTIGTHPYDFEMFTELRNMKCSLLTPIPSYSTHGETEYLAPFVNWEKQL